MGIREIGVIRERKLVIKRIVRLLVEAVAPFGASCANKGVSAEEESSPASTKLLTINLSLICTPHVKIFCNTQLWSINYLLIQTIKVIADHFLSFKYNQNVTFRYLWIQINRVLRLPVTSSFSKWGKLASSFRETL